MTALNRCDAACRAITEAAATDLLESMRYNLGEFVMSTKRFAIPSIRLRRGWHHASDFARVVEARLLSPEQYGAAHLDVGSVYFIGDALGGDAIKIGWSRDPVTRLQQLQIGNPSPLKFLGCVAANRLIEPALHHLFALSSVSGEWFADPEGSICRWLREMTFDEPISRCRWFMAGEQSVTWQWDEKALLHCPLFSEGPE
jgi:hypothetical protein